MSWPCIVLPHERLFLDHLPSADRYTKSFMHRDVLNFVTVTKSVLIYLSPFSMVITPAAEKTS